MSAATPAQAPRRRDPRRRGVWLATVWVAACLMVVAQLGEQKLCGPLGVFHPAHGATCGVQRLGHGSGFFSDDDRLVDAFAQVAS